MSAFVGIDVGGTKSAAVLIDDAGVTVERHWAEHAGRGSGQLIEIVTDAVHGLPAAATLGPGEVAGFGVAVSGLVSRDGTTLVRAPTLGETELALGSRLVERLGRPVVVVNDANATLFGHARHTAAWVEAPGDSEHDLVLFTLGTGVGGAIMTADRIVLGERGFAAELGHVLVDVSDPRVCLCGSRGCLEQFSSGRGIAELAAASPPPAATCRTLERLGVGPPYVARHVLAAAEQGDGWAEDLLRLAGTMLGRAIATLCITLDPSGVIIAGSFGHAAAGWLLPAATDELRDRWPYAAHRPLPQLRADAIGPYAAATGAALFARARHDQEEHR